MCSYGDWISLSDTCDLTTAKLIFREVSDGVIAPGFTPDALELLKTKRKGNYNIVKIDPSYVPEKIERKQVFGVTFEQGRNDFKIDKALLSNIVTKNKDLPESAKIDLIVSLITLKYTQSNSRYFTRRPEPFTEAEMRDYLNGIDGVSLGSDAFFPFSDNIDRAKKSGVRYVAEPGGSIRDQIVIDRCDEYGMVMAFTGMRLFHH